MAVIKFNHCLTLYSFPGGRLNILQARHNVLVDLQNATQIIYCWTVSHDKDSSLQCHQHVHDSNSSPRQTENLHGIYRGQTLLPWSWSSFCIRLPPSARMGSSWSSPGLLDGNTTCKQNSSDWRLSSSVTYSQFRATCKHFTLNHKKVFKKLGFYVAVLLEMNYFSKFKSS